MNKTRLLLIFLLLFIATTNWIWLNIDTQPVRWDQSDYLLTSLQYARRLQVGDFAGFFKGLIFFNRGRPPFVMLVTMPIFFFNYRNEDLAVMINILFIALIFFLIFKICKEYLEPKAAMLSCFIFSMYPEIYGLTRTYLMDIGLVAMVTLSIYLLLKCDYFRSLRYSLFLGLSLGAGMLTKQSHAVFIAGPLVYVIYKSGTFSPFIKMGNKDARLLSKPLRNLIFCLIIASVIILIWYMPNFKEAMAVAPYNNPETPFSLSYRIILFNSLKSFFLFLPYALTNHGITFFFMICFLLTSIIFFTDKTVYEIKKVLAWWIVLPFVVTTFYFYKQVRHITPFFPALAIITGQGIYRIRNGIAKAIVIGFIVAVGLIQFFADSFGIPSLLNKHRLVWDGICLFAVREWYRPEQVQWNLDEAFSSIKKDMQEEKRAESEVILLADHKAYNGNTLNYYSIKEKLGLQVNSAAWMENVYSDIKKNYPYIIYKDKDNCAADIELFQSGIDKAYAYVKDHIREFTIMKKIHLIDGSNLIIYKRN